MLHVACVNVENYQGCGEEYVAALKRMVTANATRPYKFYCMTESKERGWWAKLELFKGGIFPDGDRVVFFDLDTLIVANIDDIMDYDGPLAAMRPYRGGGGTISSCIMAWEAGKYNYIYDKWIAANRPLHPGGDDWWHNQVEYRSAGINRLYDGIVSYKFQCKAGLPAGARIVCFMRQPKPHNCTAPWVQQIWKGQ